MRLFSVFVIILGLLLLVPFTISYILNKKKSNNLTQTTYGLIEIVQPGFEVALRSMACSSTITRLQLWCDFDEDAKLCEIDIFTNDEEGVYKSILSRPVVLGDIKSRVMTDISSFIEPVGIFNANSVLVVNKKCSTSPACPSVLRIESQTFL